MKTSFANVMKKRWALVSALSLFGASLGLFAAVMLLPIGFRAHSPMLITDGSASTQEIVEAVLASERFQKTYKKAAPKALKSMEIQVEQQGSGPLFNIVAVSDNKKQAKRAVALTTSILDKKAHAYFGAYSDVKILNKPAVSEIPAENDYYVAAGFGLIAGFVLGLGISWGLTKSEKDGNIVRSSGERAWSPDGSTPAISGLPAVPGFAEDVPWTPDTTDALMNGIMEPEEAPVEVAESSEEEPVLVPIEEEIGEETPDLEPIEPFTEVSETEEANPTPVNMDETSAKMKEKTPVLDFGETPSTKPILRGVESSMIDHLPEA